MKTFLKTLALALLCTTARAQTPQQVIAEARDIITRNIRAGTPGGIRPDSDRRGQLRILDAVDLLRLTGSTAVWDSIRNKPATFPPAAHMQAISTINGLSDSLERMRAQTAEAGARGLQQVTDAGATTTHDITVSGAAGSVALIAESGSLLANELLAMDGATAGLVCYNDARGTAQVIVHAASASEAGFVSNDTAALAYWNSPNDLGRSFVTQTDLGLGITTYGRTGPGPFIRDFRMQVTHGPTTSIYLQKGSGGLLYLPTFTGSDSIARSADLAAATTAINQRVRLVDSGAVYATPAVVAGKLGRGDSAQYVTPTALSSAQSQTVKYPDTVGANPRVATPGYVRAQGYVAGTSLTTNYLTRWSGTALTNSQVWDNGTTVSVGSTFAPSATRLFVAGRVALATGATDTVWIGPNASFPTVNALSLGNGLSDALMNGLFSESGATGSLFFNSRYSIFLRAGGTGSNSQFKLSNTGNTVIGGSYFTAGRQRFDLTGNAVVTGFIHYDNTTAPSAPTAGCITYSTGGHLYVICAGESTPTMIH